MSDKRVAAEIVPDVAWDTDLEIRSVGSPNIQDAVCLEEA
jgi:hypothetical protein